MKATTALAILATSTITILGVNAHAVPEAGKSFIPDLAG